jgi:VWFA-related protein
MSRKTLTSDRFSPLFMRVFTVVLVMTFSAVLLLAQDSAPQQQPNQQAPSTQKPSEAPPAEAGGPTGDVGPIAVPKKKSEPPPLKEPKVKNPPELGNYSLRKDVALVSLDVQVKTKEGMFVPNLKAQNFRVLEDGVPQQVKDFKTQDDVPVTAVLLVEFGSTNYNFMIDALRASYTFASTLKKDDWIAVTAYDMRPHILVDFTQDKEQIYDALGTLRVPGFHEYNLFDSLYDTIDRLERVDGHKYIILVSSGLDSFSRLRLDQIYNKVKSTRDITIYAVGTGGFYREMRDSYGAMGPIARMNYLQGDNQLRTFAKWTGGKAYFPLFAANFKEVFGDIAADIRNEYVLTYSPTNSKQDGTFRKVKIELQAPDGGKLTLKDEKGKELKYDIVAREGYTAKHEVE